MPNSIALAQKFLPVLDEVYKYASLSAILDTANNRVRFDGANTVKVFKTSMQGLGNYSRNDGFVKGAVTADWETMTLTQDRGRSFQVDSMDDEETIGMAFGTLAGEFLRTQVVPEIDAYRFAKLAGYANISKATPADIVVGTTDVPALVDAAVATMNNDEVTKEGRILFLSENAYAGLKSKIQRRINSGDPNYNNEVEMYNGMIVVTVPVSRFNTAITMQDGKSSGQTDGGYKVPASTSYPINFMIVHPSAVVQVTKHAVPRIFSPDVNQDADAWKFDYRIYHDQFLLENKAAGVYLHRAATANT